MRKGSFTRKGKHDKVSGAVGAMILDLSDSSMASTMFICECLTMSTKFCPAVPNRVRPSIWTLYGLLTRWNVSNDEAIGNRHRWNGCCGNSSSEGSCAPGITSTDTEAA